MNTPAWIVRPVMARPRLARAAIGVRDLLLLPRRVSALEQRLTEISSKLQKVGIDVSVPAQDPQARATARALDHILVDVVELRRDVDALR